MQCGWDGCDQGATFIARTADGDQSVCALHRDVLMLKLGSQVEVIEMQPRQTRVVTLRMTPAQNDLLKQWVAEDGPQWSMNQWCLATLGLSLDRPEKATKPIRIRTPRVLVLLIR